MTKAFFKALAADQRGIAAIEYGLIATLIAVALSATFLSIGEDVNGHYSTVGEKYGQAANGSV